MFIIQLIVCVIVSAFAVVNHDLHVIQENYFSSYKSDYEGTLIRQHVHKLWRATAHILLDIRGEYCGHFFMKDQPAIKD